MSSQSTARAPRIRTEPRSAPVKSVAYTYASSPESLWVHSTLGCERLAAIPELSFTRRLCSVPVRATLGTLCRVRRRRITATKKIALLGPSQGVIFRPMLAALRARRVEKLPDQVVLRGRILFLAEDADLVRRQLAGEDIDWRPVTKLRDNISTDEIPPAYICYYYDETLGDFPYLGLKCGAEFPITRGSVKRGGFVASVSGKRRSKGSSREQSPDGEMCAGIKLVVAENSERIYRENCQNLGVLTTTDFSIIDKARRGEAIPLSAFTAGEGEITRGIIEYGGLFNFNVARLQGKIVLSPPATPRRPMTLGEKIIARHWVGDPAVRRAAAGSPRVRGDLPLQDPRGARRAGDGDHRKRLPHSTCRRRGVRCLRGRHDGHLQLLDHEGRAAHRARDRQSRGAGEQARQRDGEGLHARDPAPPVREERARDWQAGGILW